MAATPVSLASPSSARGRRSATLQRVAVVVVGALVIALAVIGLRHLMRDAAAPKRQVARIAVLPDKLPPPPPPPKERKEEPPKTPNKPAANPEPQVKPPQPQAAEPLKMEGAAGNGPSAFAAGGVTQDYKGGTPTIGGQAASGAGNDAARRTQERLYANSVRQLLRDELERQLSGDAGELTATFALWIESSGRIGRWEIEDHDAQVEARRQAALQAALDKSAQRLQLPPPLALAQPMRFRLTVRPGG